jgi:hypothetical protein
MSSTSARLAGPCANCGGRIIETTGPGFRVYAHLDHGLHTVCDWRADMQPTDRVATPMPSGQVAVRIPARTVRAGDQWPSVIGRGEPRKTVVSVDKFASTLKRHRGWIEVTFDDGTKHQHHGNTHVWMWRREDRRCAES